MLITSKEIFERFPELKSIFKTRPRRKYEIQDMFKLTRGEVDLIISTLTKEGYLENTALGWRWKNENLQSSSR